MSIFIHDIIIRSTVQEEHVYLLEDALDLWLAALENSVECTSGLFSLVPAVIGLLEYGSEILKKILKILESYIILVPDMIIQVCSSNNILTFYFSKKKKLCTRGSTCLIFFPFFSSRMVIRLWTLSHDYWEI